MSKGNQEKMTAKKNIFILGILFIGIAVSLLWGTTILISDSLLRANTSLFNYKDDECFCILKTAPSLGDKYDMDIPNRKEIGPLPDGKFISAYIKKGITTYEIYNGDEYNYYLRTTKKERVSFVRNFSIYDISEQISSFENVDSAYKRLRDEFELKLTAYKQWNFNLLRNKAPSIGDTYSDLYKSRIQPVSYYTKSQNGIKTIRSVYFANKKAYVLEIQANKRTEEQAHRFLGNITTLNLLDYNVSVVLKAMVGFILALLLSVIYVFVCIKEHRGIALKNKQSRKLLRFALYMTALNIVIILLIFQRIFSNSNLQFTYYEQRYIELDVFAYLMVATLILDILICTSLYIKSKKEYRYDYLIPEKWQSYFDARLDNQQEKKTLVALLYYPLFVLGSVPLGVFCLAYVIPFAIIIFITIEIRHLYRWINKDMASAMSEEGLFIDYYVVLDLKKEANKDEVERAFNTAIAKYNSANDNPLYGKRYYNSVQEAYAILSSTNQLRPEYDKEYEEYKLSNSTDYIYSNKQLESEIANIRSRLTDTKDRRRRRTLNIVIVSFTLLMVLLLIILMLTDVIPPLWESNNIRSHHIGSFGGGNFVGGNFE